MASDRVESHESKARVLGKPAVVIFAVLDVRRQRDGTWTRRDKLRPATVESRLSPEVKGKHVSCTCRRVDNVASVSILDTAAHGRANPPNDVDSRN